MSVAIVDGFSTGRYLAAELARRGVECIHVRSPEAPSSSFGRFDAAPYAAEMRWRDDLPALLRALREARVEAVVAGSETGVEPADLLNHGLGLPGNDPDLAEARRDKYEMARRLRAAGIAVPTSRLVASVPEAVEAYAGWPSRKVVVKPRASAGSDGVRICRSPAEVASATATGLGSSDIFDQVNRELLMQTLVPGDEYYLNTVSARGRHRTVDAWAYRKAPTAAGVPFYDYDAPVDRRDPLLPTLERFVGAALDALGVRHGPAHSEVMVTPAGPVLIEVAARLGGGLLPEISEKLFGCSQSSVTADLLTGGDIFSPCGGDGAPEAVRLVQLVNRVPGAVPEADWPDRLRSLPSAYAVFPRTAPGEPLPLTEDVLTSPGYVYLVGREAEVERDYRTLRRWEQEGLYRSSAVRYGAAP
jgi:biotin carboxylase